MIRTVFNFVVVYLIIKGMVIAIVDSVGGSSPFNW